MEHAPNNVANPYKVALSSVKSESVSTDKLFIEANTIAATYEEIKHHHVIPNFVKDNEALISHADFIDTVTEAISHVYPQEAILRPSIRLSHPINGRIPSARDKAAIDLLGHEKTVYYERMMFAVEIPSIQGDVGGNKLSLTVGGVKAYHLDNLYGRKGSDEHFKVFIGFQNKVCCNLKVWSDGLNADLRVKDPDQLYACVKSMFQSFNAGYQLSQLSHLTEHSLTEHQFATLIGKCQMYKFLSRERQKDIPQLRLGDSQLNNVVADYYRDSSFCRGEDGTISLWKLYNLLTSANKSNYIDTFLERSANAYQFADQIRIALMNKTASWYLS